MNTNTHLVGMMFCASVMATGTALADEPARGIDIRSTASSCRIGPFPQVGKAGEYNHLCSQLTDAEKCLALIKRYMTHEGGLVSAEHDDDRVEFCLDTFRQGLLP